MARNVEVKARIGAGRMAEIREKVTGLATSVPEFIEQTDTFFVVSHGRLKLRVFADGTGELIFYERPDSDQPTQSTYTVSPTRFPQRLSEVLGNALGVRGTVRKRRELHLVETTRIHLDAVEGLGEFLELEVVLGDDETETDGVCAARVLMERLGIAGDDLVSGAYIDLLDGGPERYWPTPEESK